MFMKKSIQTAALLLIIVWQGIAGGIIITDPQNPMSPGAGHYLLESRVYDADIIIRNGIAQTTLNQTFYNNSQARLEGWFIFPVPAGSGIKDFMMDVNGNMTRAELMDAGKAKEIYESIVRKQQDPALLEYVGADLFRIRIFPIEPRTEKKTRITFTQTLPKMGDLWEYTLPVSGQGKSTKKLQKINIRVSAEASSAIKTLYSPTFKMNTDRINANKAVLQFSASDFTPDNDFRLYVSAADDKLGISLLAHKEAGEDGFFFMDLNPGYLDETADNYPKDITFILDVSGSMSGEKIKQAKNALIFCLDKLNPSDYFEIIRFSTEAEALFGKRVPNTPGNNAKAKQYIKNLQEAGGTNIDEAFELAFAEKENADRPHIVLFLTDGKPTIGETQPDLLTDKILKKTGSGTRIFSVGIGHDLHTKLLEKISNESKGYCTYVAPEEDLELKISDIYKKLSRPVLTDIKVKVEGGTRVSQIYPREIPDLFAGSSVTLFGKFDKPGPIKITVTGKVKGVPFSFTRNAVIPDGNKHDFIPTLWATRKIGRMLEEIRLRGENEELKNEIVALSRKYGIITPYTSYLILEDEEQLVRTPAPAIPRPVLFNQGRSDAIPMKESSKKEYETLKAFSGAGSTRSGNEIRNLNMAEAISEKNQGYGRMDKPGMMNPDVKNAGGRAFVFDGKTWNQLEPGKFMKTLKIKFGSTEYFELLSKVPEAKYYVSLGRNVSFTAQNIRFEIVD
jgi:Ca-activated chloride channel family protein